MSKTARKIINVISENVHTKKKTLNTKQNPKKQLKSKENKINISSFCAPKDTDWNEWVSATQTRNYLLNDPLCDWLNLYYGKNSFNVHTGLSSSGSLISNSLGRGNIKINPTSKEYSPKQVGISSVGGNQPKKLSYSSDSSISSDSLLRLDPGRPSLLSNNITKTSFHNIKTFTDYIMEKGTVFEENVLNELYNRYSKDNIIQIGGELNPYSAEKVQETISAMQKGIPIIHGGVLHNPINKTYGIPDLIVRSDWICNIVGNNEYNESLYSIDECFIEAPNLDMRKNTDEKDQHNDNSDSDEEYKLSYHYVIIDIKFSTLKLKSDGIHLLNTGSFPAYKSQLCVYNDALSKIQGYNPQKTFILGKRWCYTTCGETYEGNDCFERLGCIDYSSTDFEFIQKTKDAIEWIKNVRLPEAKEWNIIEYPLSRKELYPNMCNYNDYPWRSVKEEIAKKTNELTGLWMVGVKNRKIAHENNIYEWNNKECNTDTLGIYSDKKKKILSAILDINKTYTQDIDVSESDEDEYKITITPKTNKRNIKITKKRLRDYAKNPKENPKKKVKKDNTKSKNDKHDVVLPKKIQTNYEEWKVKQKIEFFVDFESVNNIVTDLSSKHQSIVNMIGIGFIDPKSDEWIFKQFITDDLSIKSEGLECKLFIEYINEICQKYNIKNPPFYHWSPYEMIQWNNIIKTHQPHSNEWGRNTRQSGHPISTKIEIPVGLPLLEVSYKDTLKNNKKSDLKTIINSNNMKWVDLMYIFKEEPIVVKGCLNFGMKNIAKALYEHNLINTTWDDNNFCKSGQDTMVSSLKCERLAKAQGISMKDTPIIKEIAKYNEIDVKVLQEILYYLRENHI